jgi:hypothetical protein
MFIQLLTLLVTLVVVPSMALGLDETFVEGHVFNRRTGVPIEGAVVRLPDPCIPCARPPIPLELITDENGFYSALFWGGGSWMTIEIEVVCTTRHGEITGGSESDLRPGTVRRDIYLSGPKRLSRCIPPD